MTWLLHLHPHLHHCGVILVFCNGSHITPHFLQGAVHAGVVKGGSHLRGCQQAAQGSLHFGVQVRLFETQQQHNATAPDKPSSASGMQLIILQLENTLTPLSIHNMVLQLKSGIKKQQQQEHPHLSFKGRAGAVPCTVSHHRHLVIAA